MHMNLSNISKYIIFLVFFVFLFFLYIYGCYKDNFDTVDVNEFEKIIKENNVMILDVRTEEEFKEGHIKNAINIDYYSKDFVKTCKEKLKKDNKIAVYCQSGYRSKKSSKILSKEDFKIVNLKGGIDNWRKYNKQTVK